MGMWIRAILYSVLGMSLAGCSANHHSIFRAREIGTNGSTVLTLDAKQRTILLSNELTEKDGKVNPMRVRRFCAEPSPDVFSVIAQALSGGGAFGQSGNPASIEVALNAAFSSAEQGSTIPRTQTINMLRELMYRTCERYLSGGYDADELTIQAIRDQRLMVSILAIEQLTGAVTPRPVLIGAAGSGTAGASGDAIVRLDDARKARDTASETAAKAAKAYDEVNGTDKVCDGVKGKDEATLSDAQKLKVKPCEEGISAREKAASDLATKAAAYTELSTLARAGGVTVGTSVNAQEGGGIDRVDSGDVSAVATAVKEIVSGNFRDNTEIMLFCMRLMKGSIGTLDPNQKASLQSTCVKFFEDSVNAAGLRLTADYGVAQGAVTDRSNANFLRFWTNTRAAGFAETNQRRAFARLLRGQLLVAEQPIADCFEAAATEAAANACFSRLGSDTQLWAIAN